MFKELVSGKAVLVENGVYRQVPVVMRDGYLYAKYNRGYIRLMQNGGTSKNTCRLDGIECDVPLGMDALGRLCDFDRVVGSTQLPQHNPLGKQ